MSDKQVNVDIRRGTIVIPTDNTILAGTNSEVINGLCRWIEWVSDNMEDSDSTLLEIMSGESGTLYTSGTIAESTRTTIGTVFPMQGTISLVATAQGTQSGARDIPYGIYYTA